jgi:type IV secretion system protein VirB1
MPSHSIDPIVTNRLDDLLTPGVRVELTPEEAEALGAFEETALSEADAWEANADLADEDSDHG